MDEQQKSSPSQKLRGAIWYLHQHDLKIQQAYPDFEVFYEKVMKGLAFSIEQFVDWLGFKNQQQLNTQETNANRDSGSQTVR